MLFRVSAVLAVAATVCGCSAPPAQDAPNSGSFPKAVYDPATRRLAKLFHDSNKNGRTDTVSYMDGARILRIELDVDENGKVERWDFYGSNRQLEKVGLSQRNDGVMDSQAFYAPGGVLERIEVSTRRDGTFDRTEFYRNNVLTRSADDTNRDGKPDKWEDYVPDPNPAPGTTPYAIASTSIDETGRGVPTRRFVFGRGGRVVRVEVDPDGDGRFTPLGAPRNGAASP